MSNIENTLVAGSSPAKRTIFPQEIEKNGPSDTVLTQKSTKSDGDVVQMGMRFLIFVP